MDVEGGYYFGSSPLTRGAPSDNLLNPWNHGIIPAYAGSTLPQSAS